jgi:hypothetical protein
MHTVEFEVPSSSSILKMMVLVLYIATQVDMEVDRFNHEVTNDDGCGNIGLDVKWDMGSS